MKTIDEIKYELEAKGYCIVPNILTPDEVEYSKLCFQAWKNSIPDFNDIHNLINHSGIIKYHNIGHTRHAWFIRTRINVKNIFKTLWNTNNLIVSYDGSCYISNKNKKMTTFWTHTDQAPNLKGFQCYQGFVSLTENKERTLVVYEGSHHLHEQYFKDRNIESDNNWQILDKDYIDSISHLKKVLHVPAGSLVLWDSRTFHQNQYGEPESEERIVQYVCYFPRDHIKNTLYNQNIRKKYFKERRTTTHWPAPIKPVPIQPNYFEIDYDLLPVDNLQDLMGEIETLI